MVIHIEIGLFVSRQVGGTAVLDRGIGIPFDIGYLGMFGEQVINKGEYKILHLRVRHIEQKLRTAAPEFEFASAFLEHPFGVLLIEFGEGVG